MTIRLEKGRRRAPTRHEADNEVSYGRTTVSYGRTRSAALRTVAAITIGATFATGMLLKPGRTVADEKPADAPVSAAAAKADPLDWTYWRGPYYNGVSYETGLVDDWDPKGGPGSNLAWKRDDLGGRTSPIVMNGRAYVIVRAEPETNREGEKVVCVDAKTGETLWENRFNVYLSDVPDTRVGWSSVVGDPETDNVYVLGVCGIFRCIEGASGKTVWEVPLHERFGFLSTYGGRTNFPIICEDMVLVSAVFIGWGEMARPMDSYLALDKRTGEVIWFKGTRPLPEDTTYSAAALATVNGQKTMYFGSGDGALWAFQPRTGKPLFSCDVSMRGLNVGPIVEDDVVYIAHSEENYGTTAMGSVMAVTALKNGDVTKNGGILWRQDELMVGRASPIKIGDRIYVIDDRAKMFILDAKTGEMLFDRISLKDRVQRSTPVYADGKLYILTNNGRWLIAKPSDEEGIEILSDGAIRGAEFNGSPAISHGRIYIQSTEGLYCLADEEKTPGVAEMPPLPDSGEPPVDEDPKPAQLQIVPAEVLMKTGESQQFKARVFNSRGQLLREVDAEFSVEGPGEITADGKYTGPSGTEHQAAFVKATAEGLTGQARIRVVPPLPWKFTFEGLNDVPITWVGARYRHVLRPMGEDGNKVMVKVTTIPKGTRSRAWMGPSDMHDYTVQADIRGARTLDQLPDIGLIAQGCTLDLMGNAQKLEVRTWDPQLRTAASVPFAWKEDTWYTMKFRASVEERTDKDGKPQQVAVFRGKVWPRGEEEPADWIVEVIDYHPTPSGSPGLYGNAKVAELYLDNVEVTPND